MTGARALGLLAVAYLGLLLFAALPTLFPGLLPMPDVSLLVTLHAGLSCRLPGGATVTMRDPGPAAVAAFGVCLGYLTDLLGGGPKGLHALGLALLMLLLRGAATRLLVRGWVLVMAFVFVAAVLFGVLLYGLRAWAEPGESLLPLRALVYQALATALCAPLLFSLLRRVDARVWHDPRAQGLSL